jgi:hypothetical protein
LFGKLQIALNSDKMINRIELLTEMSYVRLVYILWGRNDYQWEPCVDCTSDPTVGDCGEMLMIFGEGGKGSNGGDRR